MIVSYFYLDTWLGEGEGAGGLSITALTVMFFLLSLLTATQDVAVDGWSLTMLRPANLGLAATCNSVGMQLGWLLGFVVFTTLGGELAGSIIQCYDYHPSTFRVHGIRDTGPVLPVLGPGVPRDHLLRGALHEGERQVPGGFGGRH